VKTADLASEIDRVAVSADEADRDHVRELFVTLRHALSRGEVRAAEPDPASPSGWRVNAWVKRGILLGFKFGRTVELYLTPNQDKWPFLDKDTLPLKHVTVPSGVRIVPGGSSVRDGAYLGKGVICMPPMYINIGAWIGDETLVDSHALVGSCAHRWAPFPSSSKTTCSSVATAASTKARSSNAAPCSRRARSSPALRRFTTW
jgi:2,3,4,5-tetrahydropyridine-2-carboxylate N-succinyltransferase